MGDSILVIKGFSQYDVLLDFADEMVAAFEQLGHQCVVWSPQVDVDPHELIQLLEKHDFTFIFSFNGVFMNYPPVRGIIDASKLVVYSFFVDNPIFHADRIRNVLPHQLVSFVANEHFEPCSLLINSTANMHFVPHGAPIGLVTGELDGSRPIDILFTGTYENPEAIRAEWRQYPETVQVILQTMVQRVIADRKTSFVDVCLRVLKELDISLRKTPKETILDLLFVVDRYARAHWRDKLLRDIQELPVHVYGNGWNDFSLHSASNTTFHPAANFQDVRHLMAESKVVIDMNPSFTHGAHERVFTAMAAGAAVMAMDNEYLRTTFSHGDNIYLYDPDANLASQVRSFMGDEGRLAHISRNGATYVRQAHTWYNRAQQVLDIVATVRKS